MSQSRSQEEVQKTLQVLRRIGDQDRWSKHPLRGSGSLTHLYLQLCGISRRVEDSPERKEALGKVRDVRIQIERAIWLRWERLPAKRRDEALVAGDVFGHSSKQGVSFRLGLESCSPTHLCRTRCYAHDGNDCLPEPVIRGAQNSILAWEFEHGDPSRRTKIENLLMPHTKRAAGQAVKEMLGARKNGFLRAPRVRFSHVGDIGDYPEFANRLGGMILHYMDHISDGLGAPPPRARHWPNGVIVTYTRKNCDKLSPYWTILYSCDPSTPFQLKAYAKDLQAQNLARRAWCAFNGQANANADITFAEHHGPRHLEVHGDPGFVCPATRKSNHLRGCDANRCDLCFRPM